MNKSLLIGLCFFIFCPAWALLEVNDNTFTSFSELQMQKSKSNMQLAIAQLELERLKIQDQINKLSGVYKKNIKLKRLELKILEISIFNNKSFAVISIDGITKTYKIGDVLSKGLVLNKISNKSIEIINTKTKKRSLYFISQDLGCLVGKTSIVLRLNTIRSL